MYLFFAPFSKGGMADYEDAVEKIYSDEALRKGRKREEIRDAVRYFDHPLKEILQKSLTIVMCQVTIAKNGTDKVNGTVIRVPGVREMYDYEREGYNVPMPPG